MKAAILLYQERSSVLGGGVSRENGVRGEPKNTVHRSLTKPPNQSSWEGHPASGLQGLRVNKSPYYLRYSELGFLFLDPEQRLNRKGNFSGAPHASESSPAFLQSKPIG